MTPTAPKRSAEPTLTDLTRPYMIRNFAELKDRIAEVQRLLQFKSGITAIGFQSLQDKLFEVKLFIEAHEAEDEAAKRKLRNVPVWVVFEYDHRRGDDEAIMAFTDHQEALEMKKSGRKHRYIEQTMLASRIADLEASSDRHEEAGK